MTPHGSACWSVLPAEQFYWAVLDASKLTSAGRRKTRRQLGYMFESVLPVSIEEVQASYVRLSGGRYLACGMDKRLLQAECDGHVYLGPDRVPSHLGDEAKAEQINLLTNEFEPKMMQRMKVRWLLQLAAMMALAAMLVAIGLQRRATTYQHAIATVENARQRVFQHVGIDSSGGGSVGGSGAGGGQPAELRLTAELRRLRQTRQAPAAEAQLIDVTPTLAALLARWPDDARMQTETVSITPTAITVRGIVPASAGAQTVASSMISDDGQPDLQFRGWKMVQPQVTNVRDGVQLVLQMIRAEEGRP